MFESRHDWFEHEVNHHRKLWARKVVTCREYAPRSKPELVVHLRDHHALTDEGIEELELESWRKPRIDVTECPLCRTYATRLQQVNNWQKCDVTLAQFRRHLGEHFQQLALAALPIDTEDEDEVDKPGLR
jgi:hypothetical protein